MDRQGSRRRRRHRHRRRHRNRHGGIRNGDRLRTMRVSVLRFRTQCRCLGLGFGEESGVRTMRWWDFQISVTGPDMYGGRGMRRIGRIRDIGPLARNIDSRFIRRTWCLDLDERRIHNCNESMTHLVRGIRVTDANFHASSRRGKSLFLNQLLPVLDIGDRNPIVFL